MPVASRRVLDLAEPRSTHAGRGSRGSSSFPSPARPFVTRSRRVPPPAQRDRPIAALRERPGMQPPGRREPASQRVVRPSPRMHSPARREPASQRVVRRRLEAGCERSENAAAAAPALRGKPRSISEARRSGCRGAAPRRERAAAWRCAAPWRLRQSSCARGARARPRAGSDPEGTGGPARAARATAPREPRAPGNSAADRTGRCRWRSEDRPSSPRHPWGARSREGTFAAFPVVLGRIVARRWEGVGRRSNRFDRRRKVPRCGCRK